MPNTIAVLHYQPGGSCSLTIGVGEEGGLFSCDSRGVTSSCRDWGGVGSAGSCWEVLVSSSGGDGPGSFSCEAEDGMGLFTPTTSIPKNYVTVHKHIFKMYIVLYLLQPEE